MNKILSLIICLVFIVSCGGRLPKPKTSEGVIDRYFHKYGHKFKQSDFGKYQVEEVNILDTREIHKHLVAVSAEVKLTVGPIYMVRCILEKKSFGWRFISWEKL